MLYILCARAKIVYGKQYNERRLYIYNIGMCGCVFASTAVYNNNIVPPAQR